MDNEYFAFIICSYFGGKEKSPDLSLDYDDSMLSDYESGSPPSRDENSMSFPSLQQKINTNFTNLKLEPVTTQRHKSFDFGSQYRQLYLNHEREPIVRHRNSDTVKWIINQASVNLNNVKSKSCDKLPSENDKTCNRLVNGVCNGDVVNTDTSKVPPIWCMDYLDNLIVLGCSDGRLEFWEGTTGKFKCIFEDGSGIGVTSLKLIGSRVIVAKLNGSIDFLQLQSYSQGRQIDWGFTSAYRRSKCYLSWFNTVKITQPESRVCNYLYLDRIFNFSLCLTNRVIRY